MCCFVKVFSGWVDRTGLSDTVLVAGSYEVTPPWRVVGGVDRSIQGQHHDGCVSRLLGQTPPAGSSCGSWQVFECLAGDVAFEAAHDLAG